MTPPSSVKTLKAPTCRHAFDFNDALSILVLHFFHALEVEAIETVLLIPFGERDLTLIGLLDDQIDRLRIRIVRIVKLIHPLSLRVQHETICTLTQILTITIHPKPYY